MGADLGRPELPLHQLRKPSPVLKSPQDAVTPGFSNLATTGGCSLWQRLPTGCGRAARVTELQYSPSFSLRLGPIPGEAIASEPGAGGECHTHMGTWGRGTPSTWTPETDPGPAPKVQEARGQRQQWAKHYNRKSWTESGASQGLPLSPA